MEVKDLIKDARNKAGLTQEQAADKLMVSRQSISHWENGKTLPNVSDAIRMSDLYQISLDELLKGDKKMVEKIEKDDRNRRSEKLVVIMSVIVMIVACVSNFFTVFRIGMKNASTYRIILSYSFDICMILMSICTLGFVACYKIEGGIHKKAYNMFGLSVVFLFVMSVMAVFAVFDHTIKHRVMWVCCGLIGIIASLRMVILVRRDNRSDNSEESSDREVVN